jgi:predicted membrane protein
MTSTNVESRGFLTPRVVIGLLVVAFGVAMLLDNLDVLSAARILRYWPFGVVMIGIAYILRGDSRSERSFGGVVAIVGMLFALDLFFGVRIQFWRWWPIAIVLFGLLIVSRAFHPQDATSKVQVGVVFGGSTDGSKTETAGSAARGGSHDPTYTEVAIWSGIERRVASPAFKRADLTAIMGGIEFDLRQAATDQGEAVIEVFAVWGGIEITVPPDWAVSNRVTAIMGGAEDQSSGTQMSRNRLVVKGVVVMGGVTIKT